MLIDVNLKEMYSTSNDNLIDDFYIPCFKNSVSYERIAGYFSSALYSLIPIAFSEFIKNKGSIKIICSPNLTQIDRIALMDTNTLETVSREQISQELENINATDDLGKSLISLVKNLINANVLELRIAIPVNGRGIYHDKVGIFSDSKNMVSFVGSANETAAAWSGVDNHEQIDIFPSWFGPESRKRNELHKQLFDRSWQGYIRNWKILKSEDTKNFLDKYPIDENFEVSLNKIKDLLVTSPSLKKSRNFEKESRPLRQHQLEVLEDWKNKNFNGLVTFATGGGKTLVGVNAAKIIHQKKLGVLILVPTLLLMKQWISEIYEEIPEVQLVAFGGNFPFTGRGDILENTLKYEEGSFRIAISTFATASNIEFRKILNKSNFGLIIDEVHGIGSILFREILKSCNVNFAMGLSATPERFGDDTGTKIIFDFFKNKLKPEFLLKDAISSSVLVPYTYNLAHCSLSEEEDKQYEKLSEEIGKLQARLKNLEDSFLSERLKLLLIRRANIVKGARAKVPLALEILKDNFQEGDRWLVYCQNQTQMKMVREEISCENFRILEYHSNLVGDKDAQLDFFSKEGGVMLAIKCLDEGIDIPVINKALILASSNNPREYIQRRGRVLRNFPGKNGALIIDTCVSNSHGKIVSISELVRALEFSRWASNKAVQFEIEDLLRKSGYVPVIDDSVIEEDADEQIR